MFDINTVLDDVLAKEGGYQSDKEDNGNWTGGKVGKGTLVGTKLGITPQALAAYKGTKASSITAKDIKAVTPELARQVYLKNYYYKYNIDKLPENLQATVFDMNINAGPKAIKTLQKLVGVKPNGVVDTSTVEAIGDKDLLQAYTNSRIDHYKDIVKRNPDKAKYLKGWITRATSFNPVAMNDLSLQPATERTPQEQPQYVQTTAQPTEPSGYSLPDTNPYEFPGFLDQSSLENEFFSRKTSI